MRPYFLLLLPLLPLFLATPTFAAPENLDSIESSELPPQVAHSSPIIAPAPSEPLVAQAENQFSTTTKLQG
jgi:hypothetical protein